MSEYLEKVGVCTNGETFDGFVFGCAACAVGTADWFGVSASMFVAAVVSTRQKSQIRERWMEDYLLLTVMMDDVGTYLE